MGEAEAVPADEKQADSGLGPADESVIWSQEVEVCLFHAMLGHKPVEEIIQEVKEGKLVSEDDVKEEFKEERDPPATHEEGSNSSVKMVEKPSVKDKERERERERDRPERVPGEAAQPKEAVGEKRKRNRATEKMLSSSNPSSPGGAKRRRT